MKGDLMQRFATLAPTLTLLWAGVALGGNIIAAPAKFQVQSLTTAELLQVGRAQFAWLGIAELAIAAGLIIVLLFGRTRPTWTLAVAMVLLAVQQFTWQPALEARSDLIATGGTPEESHLHLIFVVAEIAKFLLLISAGYVLLARHSRNEQPQ